jgi:predicted transposase YdaD
LAKPFDATTKRLLEIDPAGWLTCVGLPVTGPVRAVDSDVSTVTAEADTILQVGEPADYLAHIELQVSHDLTLPRRLLHYNVLLNYRHDRPVRSVAIILRRQADSPSLVGHHQVLLPDGSSYLDFRYSVLRLWTMDVETILQSGLGTLPLAPLANVFEKDLPSVIGRMKQRLDREVTGNESNLLWTATKILMGMRYSKELAESLLQGVRGMKESVTYQAIVEEGVIKSRKEDLLFIGRKRFGTPKKRIVATIEGIEDEKRLKRMIDQSFDVSTWDELLVIL